MPLAGPAPDATVAPTHPAHAANLAEIAGLCLRRLAAETRAAAALPPVCALCGHVAEVCRCGHLRRQLVPQGAAALAETRREAVGALERLRDALPSGDERHEARTQAMRIDRTQTATPDDLDRWAAEHDAWALAADPAGGSATAEQHWAVQS